MVEGHEYNFKIYAINDIGQSEPAMNDEPITAKLPFDPPGPPEDIKVKDLTKTSCTLTWSPPEFDGGSPVTGYYVERRSGTRWIKVNKKPVKKCALEIDDLLEGSENELRVCAENDAGIGKPSDSTGKFIAKDPFDVPDKPNAPEIEKVTKDAVSLAWQPPKEDGGAPITNYIVEMRRVGDVKWQMANKGKPTPDTKFDVTGLPEEVEYEFRVTAENKAGAGPPSAPSKPTKYGTSLFMADLSSFNILKKDLSQSANVCISSSYFILISNKCPAG